MLSIKKKLNNNIIFIMESDETISSHPLKHLLSLEWDDANDMSLTTKSEEENGPPKQKKKVRFSDTVEQNFLDSNDLESNISNSDSENDYSSQYEEISIYEDNIDDEEYLDDEEYVDDVENVDDVDIIDDGKSVDDEGNVDSNTSSESQFKLKDNLLQSEELPHSDIMESLPVNNQVKNLDNLNAEVEKQIIQFSCQIQNEKSEIVHGGSDNKFDVTNSDATGLYDSKTELDTFGTILSEKKIYRCDKGMLPKQSEKINELLNNTDLTFSNALQIKQAVWEAWSTVKKWEYLAKKHTRNKTSEKSDHMTESVAKKAEVIQRPLVSRKRVTRKKKKTNLSNVDKQILSSTKQREKSKADKEESELAFKSWKKHKEEILKQNAMKQHNEKLQKRMSSLMNEEIKKERAESAYIEWKMKKLNISNKEKEKKAWLMQKEKEANEQKLQRDKESQEIFQEWLERKYFQDDYYSMTFNDKPPWLPPGYS